MRQPLEDRVVSIARVQGSALFPADFILLAALNPYRSSEDGTTDYAAAMLDTYKGKISGPILDRMDLWLEVPHVPYDTLTQKSGPTDETKQAREAIVRARERQAMRLVKRPITTNAEMSSRDLEECVQLSDEVTILLTQAATRLNLSPRGYHRVIKVARTIADLADAEELEAAHILEALQYRVKF